METTANKTTEGTRSLLVNRLFYGTMVLLGMGYALADHLQDGAAFLGVALAFDPFHHNIAWAKRPAYQKIWLLAHLAVLAVVATIGFGS